MSPQGHLCIESPCPICIAWVAGIFEGEGTIGLPKTGYSVRASIRMDDRDVIERVYSVMGFGLFRQLAVHRPHDRIVIQYNYQVSSAKQVIAFLEAILPHLGERRRKKALEAIASAHLVGSHKRRPWTPEARAHHMETIARKKAQR